MSSNVKFEQLDKFRDDLDKCTKCGFCMSFCPVYREERIESSVARGKVMLIRALLSGELELSDEMAEHLNKCTLCMTCAENCPADAAVHAIITAARADKTGQKGLSFPYKILFRWLLPRRRLFGYAVRIAAWFQGIFLPKTEGTIRHLSLFLAALGKGRHIPQIAPKFLRQSVPELNRPPEGMATTMTVGYFTGCMTDFVFPNLGKKVIEFLTGNGVEVIVPRRQGCCGAPVFLGAGDFVTGRKLADTKRYDAVICLGAVIRGETPHFDYVATQVTRDTSRVGLDTGLPVVYGIITADTLEDAIERAGTKMGNKGFQAAVTAIEVANLVKNIA